LQYKNDLTKATGKGQARVFVSFRIVLTTGA